MLNGLKIKERMRIFHINKPYVILTMGDPSGIGPEITFKSLNRIKNRYDLCIILIGDRYAIESPNYEALKIPYIIHDVDGDIHLQENVINIIDPVPDLRDITCGIPNRYSAIKSLSFLETAVKILREIKNDKSKALITGPVNKEMIANISDGFIGHTEYLQNAFNRDHVTMALVGKKFTAIPVTRHIPVREISSKLTIDLIRDTLEDVRANIPILSAKKDPAICVCALNPHCGEGGKIGDEESKIIRPAVESMKNYFNNLIGPVSPDAAFYKALNEEYDVVLGMYHDQCLAPFKMVEFDTGVNTTLGLGFIRTSPDHGTAYDIAGTDSANSESMLQALKLAMGSFS